MILAQEEWESQNSDGGPTTKSTIMHHGSPSINHVQHLELVIASILTDESLYTNENTVLVKRKKLFTFVSGTVSVFYLLQCTVQSVYLNRDTICEWQDSH